MKKKIVAVIPARGGSKGVPDKNIRLLDDKPLISYTIKAAVESQIFDRIIVSTDSDKIATTALACGAEVPYKRPDSLATDAISSEDAILHALTYLEENEEYYDCVCKLQPTSPLRGASDIVKAFELYNSKCADFLVSVCECEHSPLWSGQLNNGIYLDDFMENALARSCRQELPTFYRLNGAIYLGDVNKYKINKSFLGKNCVAYIMEQLKSIDIDSEIDFYIAECLLHLAEKIVTKKR